MSLRLILVRHAKSSWDSPLHDDHGRQLNKRGRQAAPRIAKWLAARQHTPQQVLSSDAARTLETWERMAPAFDTSPTLQAERALYLAPPEVMLKLLQSASASPVLMLGHNPGIGAFAEQLLAQTPAHERFYDYPTCATLVAEFEIERWSELELHSGRALDFAVPADLA